MGGYRREPLYRVPIWKRTPPVGAYLLTPSASSVEFRGRAFGASVTGRVEGVSGSVVVEDALELSSVAVKIPIGCLDTGMPWRDSELRGPYFLAAQEHPEIAYEGDCVQPLGKATYAVHGEVTVRGIRQPAVLTAELQDVWEDDHGRLRARLTGQTVVERKAFGVPRSESFALWGLLVPRKVKVRFDVELVAIG